MESFIVEGGHALQGTIRPAGNKNAALPCLAACLLTDQEVTLHNVPDIRDVAVMLSLLEDLGAEVQRLDGPGDKSPGYKVVVRAHQVRKQDPDPRLTREMRASFLLAGPLLARCGSAVMPRPGGDMIGPRRLDTHLLAFEALGSEVEIAHAQYTMRVPHGLQGQPIFLDEASVMGTENAVMAAVTARGTTIVRNAASEPHVQDLCRLLNVLGARIEGIGTNTLIIHGVEGLHGGEYTIGPDYMEIGSFIGLAAVTGSELTIAPVVPDDLHMIRLVFQRLGVRTELQGDALHVPRHGPLRIVADVHEAIPKVDDGPWPAFPADLVSVAIVVATQAEGTVLIWEKMFESRLFFVDKLLAMGARLVLCDPHRLVAVGPAPLHGEEMVSPDIRAGIALLIAALCAEGQSTIRNIQQIDRGYERIEQRLSALGAHITRVRD